MGAVAAERQTLSVEEYLDLDARADDARFEYENGHVYALAGAQPEHNLIKDNIRSELHARLRTRGCRSFTSDQRVRISDRFVYPDVVVVCGEPVYTDESPRSLRNPNLLVEVTSESTAQRDHESKFDAYTALDSLEEYWIVSSNQPLLVQHVRRGDEWVTRSVSGEDAAVRCSAFDVEIDLSAIYDLVDWNESTAGAAPGEENRAEDAESGGAESEDVESDGEG